MWSFAKALAASLEPTVAPRGEVRPRAPLAAPEPTVNPADRRSVLLFKVDGDAAISEWSLNLFRKVM
jgi:hypothetical protein